MTKLPAAEFWISEFEAKDVQDVGDFTCGDDDLDDFLRSDAQRLAAANISRTYLARHPDTGDAVLGYISLSADSIRLDEAAREGLGIAVEFQAIPALKVGRLACRKDDHCRGAGTAMMRFAYVAALSLAKTAGVRLLTVDAYPKAVSFYEKLGFVPNEMSGKKRTTVSMRLDVFAPTPPSWAQLDDE